MNEKRVYTFGNGKAEGRADMRNLLGGKGANLAEMNLIGVPVPPGFTITTEVCNEYFEKGKADVVALLKDDVEKSVHHIENLMGLRFGDAENPAARQCALRCPRFHARYDGHHPQPRSER
jgi:pyruvate,orthophosphate dikinase